MSALDAQITAQLQSLKQANMGNPMMGGPPRPGQPNPGFPGMPQGMVGPGGPPQAMPPQGLSPMGPGPPPGPQNAMLLSVAVNNLPYRYQLQENDLREMCQRWGQLQAVHIYRDGAREVGVIVFADPVDASDCQRQLNGHTCNFDGPSGPVQGSLAAAVGEPQQLSPPLARQQGPPGALPMGAAGPGGPPMGMGGPPPMATLGGIPVGQPPMQGQMMGMGMQGAMAKSSPEPMKGCGKGPGWGGPGWCCKVIVQAERLHPNFEIVTKIVGVNNMNLEHIRSQGACNVEVRGQRSGTIDNRIGQELPEPMFLWLASDTPESGVAALEMVKDLLGSVYDEHQQWCAQNNFQWQNENLQPTVIENPPDGF